MPELPDVESFKRYLDATSLHQRIEEIQVKDADLLKGVSARKLSHELAGCCFESTRRHGKHLFVHAGPMWLRLHFGMTGFLSYFKDEQKAPPHTRVLFVFDNSYRLAFDDQRKFGEVGWVKDADEFVEKRGLGRDALDFDFRGFRKTMGKHRGAVKPTLMHQQIIAGIGNIYADEILFQARMHPATNLARLDEKKLQDLFRTMRRVLLKAINCQADSAQMPRSWLLHQRGKSGRCPKCGRKLKSATIGGRTTWFCPHDQAAR